MSLLPQDSVINILDSTSCIDRANLAAVRTSTRFLLEQGHV